MTDVLIPGGRDVRATLEEPPDTGADESRPVVVACPPHPQHGGHRGDRRLVAVADRLCETGIACLRIDYGAWDEGYGEREDVRNAVRWAADRDESEAVGVFGYSFGASLALLASATVDRPVTAVSALAPTARLGMDDDGEVTAADERTSERASDDERASEHALEDRASRHALDAVAALANLPCPAQVIHGERDGTVDWEPVVERARALEHDVVSLSADHFFVGQDDAIAETAGRFLERRLLE